MPLQGGPVSNPQSPINHDAQIHIKNLSLTIVAARILVKVGVICQQLKNKYSIFFFKILLTRLIDKWQRWWWDEIQILGTNLPSNHLTKIKKTNDYHDHVIIHVKINFSSSKEWKNNPALYWHHLKLVINRIPAMSHPKNVVHSVTDCQIVAIAW